MSSIKLKNVSKWFGKNLVIKNVNLEIKDGEFVVLVGPSGCGKSTLLRIISGLEDLDEGKILINLEDVTSKIPSERELSMVFQSYALYPHMNVSENIGFRLGKHVSWQHVCFPLGKRNMFPRNACVFP